MSLGLETCEILLSYAIVYRRPPCCFYCAVVGMCYHRYHALSQWTCVLHGYFAWLYAQNLTQIIPPFRAER